MTIGWCMTGRGPFSFINGHDELSTWARAKERSRKWLDFLVDYYSSMGLAKCVESDRSSPEERRFMAHQCARNASE